MLDVAQKAVRVLQSVARAPRQQSALGEGGERSPRAAHAKVGLPSPPHDLQCLCDEFDFTNAAASELDVVRVGAGALLFANLPMNIAQAFIHVVIEILAVHERRDVTSQLVVPVAGQWAGLEPCVPFPCPSLCDKVMLERDERRRQRSAFPVRTEPHVDAEDVAVGGDLIERANHAATKPIEKFTIGNRTGTARIAFFWIHEYEIDIGRDIELAAAQLPHADDDQLLRRPGFRADRIAPHDGELAVMKRLGSDKRRFRQRRDGEQHLVQVRAPSQVAA